MRAAESGAFSGLPASAAALAVVAHPDDESFGLGAILSTLAQAGTNLAVLCFTHGEASTLIAGLDRKDRLHTVRAAELEAASQALGIHTVDLRAYPDGHLSDVPVDQLADVVQAKIDQQAADLLIVFDEGGITGHPDHIHATQAALAAADRLGLPVLGWSISQHVADQLNADFGTTFAGRDPTEIDHWITIDRTLQLAAIACHRSQSTSNPVLWRRLELTGHQEPLSTLRPDSTHPNHNAMRDARRQPEEQDQ
jgi:N-acetylglucosamine malate deacetylase 2